MHETIILLKTRSHDILDILKKKIYINKLSRKRSFENCQACHEF